ncbi:hypothetical protein K440DRAFT_556022 [Wilcoxina mikolae CBS 423.85]|nr:hypothetical protein K440DRAFT_556022 [Wilcoxina mikolae CBS 423.85]
MVPSFSIVAAFLISSVAKTGAQVIWDGRLHCANPLVLDVNTTSPYNVNYNKGQSNWSDIVSFPEVTPSLFDIQPDTKAWELSINDKSIFVPGGPSSRQNGFRRSELMPNINNGSDKTVQGIRTLHFSIQKDMKHPLNVSHLYQLTFIETADFSSHIWTLSYGATTEEGHSPTALRLTSSGAKGAKEKLLFQVEFKEDQWHNFAIQVDFDNNALSAYYSAGYSELKRVVKLGKGQNDSTGKDHIGILKQPTGETKDVVHQGYQPSGINEGVLYGGVFIEEGTKVCRGKA